MGDDPPERRFQQRPSRLDPMPGGSTRGVRQRDEVEAVTPVFDAEFLANDLGQFVELDELPDGKLPNRDHQRGSKNREFGFEPVQAVGNFSDIRNAVSAGAIATGKTAAHRGHIDRSSIFRFSHSAGALEPAK